MVAAVEVLRPERASETRLRPVPLTQGVRHAGCPELVSLRLPTQPV